MHTGLSEVTAPNAFEEIPTSSLTAADHRLRVVLDLLAARGIDAAQVRPPSRDGRGRLEADVVVRPTQRTETEAVLATLGFRRRAGWGRAPHRFHVGVVGSGASGIDWLKIDLVSDLSFGPMHELWTRSAGVCLSARSAEDQRMRRLSPADEFAALLLHSLLDQRGLNTDRRERLAALAPSAHRPGALAAGCGLDAVGQPDWTALVDAVERADWDRLLAAGPVLRARLLRGQRWSSTVRRVHHRVARRLSKLSTAIADRGPLVAVIGPDGAGKSTLTSSVAAQAGLPARVLYGGTHPAGTHSSVVPGFTTGRILLRLGATHVRIVWHRRRGRLVILDRHPLQVRPNPTTALPARTRRRRKLLSSTLPAPDLLIVLDAPVAVLRARRPEHDWTALAADRSRHLDLLVDHRMPTVRIDATASPDQMVRETVEHIWLRAVPLRPAVAGWSRT